MATIQEDSSVIAMVPGIVGLICWQSRQAEKSLTLEPTVEISHAILMHTDF